MRHKKGNNSIAATGYTPDNSDYSSIFPERNRFDIENDSDHDSNMCTPSGDGPGKKKATSPLDTDKNLKQEGHGPISPT